MVIVVQIIEIYLRKARPGIDEGMVSTTLQAARAVLISCPCACMPWPVLLVCSNAGSACCGSVDLLPVL